MLRSKKSSSKSNVIVGGVKKHHKRIWIASLAVLLLLSVGAGSFALLRGQSLKAKAENWTPVIYSYADGYNAQACKIPAYGGYVVKVFAMRTPSSSKDTGLQIMGIKQGQPVVQTGSITNWQAGWGFYYINASLVVPPTVPTIRIWMNVNQAGNVPSNYEKPITNLVNC